MTNLNLTLTDAEAGSLLALVRDAAAEARRNNVKYYNRGRYATADRWLAIAVHWEAVEAKLEAAALEV